MSGVWDWSVLAESRLSAPHAAMGPWLQDSPSRDRIGKHFPPTWEASSDDEAEHGPREFFNRQVKNDHTRSRSLPNCGYVGRWHAHKATTGGPHRYTQKSHQRPLVGVPH